MSATPTIDKLLKADNGRWLKETFLDFIQNSKDNGIDLHSTEAIQKELGVFFEGLEDILRDE